MGSKRQIAWGTAVLCVLTICSFRVAYGAPPNDPCSLLTPAQVSAVLGVSIDPAQHVAPTLCQWSAPNQPNSINAKKVALFWSNARAFGYAKNPITNSVTTTPVSGIGDDAVYATTRGVTPRPGHVLICQKEGFVFHPPGLRFSR